MPTVLLRSPPPDHHQGNDDWNADPDQAQPQADNPEQQDAQAFRRLPFGFGQGLGDLVERLDLPIGVRRRRVDGHETVDLLPGDRPRRLQGQKRDPLAGPDGQVGLHADVVLVPGIVPQPDVAVDHHGRVDLAASAARAVDDDRAAAAGGVGVAPLLGLDDVTRKRQDPEGHAARFDGGGVHDEASLSI